MFNPGNPDCLSITQRSCVITIDNQVDRQIKCDAKYKKIGNSRFYFYYNQFAYLVSKAKLSRQTGKMSGNEKIFF